MPDRVFLKVLRRTVVVGGGERILMVYIYVFVIASYLAVFTRIRTILEMRPNSNRYRLAQQ